MTESRQFGFVGIVGRPNVGKSTLMNAFLGQKISIVTPKPQTTRHRVVGVMTRGAAQIAFIDTPGLHESRARAMEQAMNRGALRSMHEADLVLAVFAALELGPQDRRVVKALEHAGRTAIAVVNKVDRVKPKTRLLPYLDELSQIGDFEEIFPVSARTGDNLDALEEYLLGRLPEGEWHYPDGEVSDRDERFFAAEIVRERLMLSLGQELPYGLAVEIEGLEQTEAGVELSATVWVERESQKPIVIGRDGERLKAIGRAARLALKKRYDRPVHLSLWVKVKKNWAQNLRALKALGYDVS